MNDFHPYRFSPIKSHEELLRAIHHIHVSCHELLERSLNRPLSNAGNIGVFCHYDDEFDYLKKLRDELCVASDNPDQKYFELKQPIVIPAESSIPQTTYTHLYVRKPDPYRYQAGDIDFFMAPDDYTALKTRLATGEALPCMRLFDRNDLDMIELYHPDIDALAYISTNTMTENVRIKLSDSTKL